MNVKPKTVPKKTTNPYLTVRTVRMNTLKCIHIFACKWRKETFKKKRKFMHYLVSSNTFSSIVDFSV